MLDKTALFNTKPLGKQSKEEYGREDINVSQVAKRNMVRHLARSLHVQDFMAFEKSIYIRVSPTIWLVNGQKSSTFGQRIKLLVLPGVH